MSVSVSVVMSVQDAAEYLAPTMESVLGQGDVDFELVAVDESSTSSELYLTGVTAAAF